MKIKFFTKFLSLLFAVAVCTQIGFAQQNQEQNTKQTPVQQTQQAQPSPQNLEPLGEDESIPFMREQEKEAQTSGVSTGGLLVKTLGAMLLIVGLIFFGAWGLKKVGFNPLKKQSEGDVPDLSVLSSVSLGTNRTLSVVKFGERVLLVGSTAQSFTLLADKGEMTADEEEFTASNPRSVGEMLAEESASNNTKAAFERDFIDAQKRMNFYEQTGGKA
jgi:flagellar biosynthetic protein FliO